MTLARKLVLSATLMLLAIPAQAGEYTKPYVGDMQVYKAKYEDTFVQLARDYNLGYVELRAANPDVDPWLPGAGTPIILPLRALLPDAPHSGIVINMPEMRLFAYVNGDGPPDTYPIGVGREGLQTPVGSTFVARKMKDPIWRPTPRMLKEHPELKPEVGPGPDNPQGNRILYLNWPEYGIHGTNKPFGIGRRSSSGCIRMYPESILNLYDKIPVGTKVTVVNQPIKLAWIGDKLYLEAHTDIDQAVAMEETGHVSDDKLTDDDMRQIMKVAGPYQNKLHWAAIRQAVRERKGYPIVIARRLPNGDVVADEQDDAYQEATAVQEHQGGAPNERDVFETQSGNDIPVKESGKAGEQTATAETTKQDISVTVATKPKAVRAARNGPADMRPMNQ